MIRLESISYSSPSMDISNLSFHLPKGDTAIILGPRKEGKTAFLKVCMGVIPITAGEVTVIGKKLNTDKTIYFTDKIEDIGFVTQHVTLLDNMTVLDNIGLPLAYHLGMDGSEIRKRVIPLMEKAGIADSADKFPHEISGDDAKLAQITRAIVLGPKLLLMDEPTTGDLDPEGFLRISEVIKDFHSQDITMMISTCSFSLASLRGFSCYYFIGGELIPHSEAEKSSHPKVISYLSEMRLYFEKQAAETTQFFPPINLDGMLKE